MYVRRYAPRGQKTASRVLLYHFPPIPLRQDLSLKLPVFLARREASKPQQSSCLCLSTPGLFQERAWSCPAFYLGSGVWFQVLMLAPAPIPAKQSPQSSPLTSNTAFTFPSWVVRKTSSPWSYTKSGAIGCRRIPLSLYPACY